MPRTASATPTDTAYEELIGLVKQASLLESTAALLGWDQETMMPRGGVEHRSRQLAQLASLHHRLVTDPRMGELLSACADNPDLNGDPVSESAANIREIRRTYERRTKLPAKLVEELARVTSLAQHEWAEARRDSDFARFRPWLEKIVELTRRKAECFGWPDGGEPWDALAEEFEPGCTAANIEDVFRPLRRKLQALVSGLTASRTRPSEKFMGIELPIERQEAFVRFVSEQIGFDYTRGRLDRSNHPFCSGTHCHDVRLTTRFNKSDVIDALGSTMHEAGHGIYEQGLSPRHIGTPMGLAAWHGIHESQSRLWENQVGRSLAFWTWCLPHVKEFFGRAVSGLTLDDVYGSANVVRPDFIRVEADEATYNMHIMIRFDIERALMNGELAVPELPAVWNRKYKEYLDLDVPDDRRGCLQDIHWSGGSFGYFPSYSLGNLYAAQFFEKARMDMPDLLKQVEKGQFGGLKQWLNEKIHCHGQRYSAADLCRRVTGRDLGAEPLLRYLEAKLRPLHGL